MATQKDIARMTGVSPSLVSRVLNGTAADIGIAQATIEKIQSAAKSLNYFPNSAARSLKGKETKIIGVIVRTFHDAFLGTILDELNREATEAGATLLVKGFREGRFNADEINSLLSYSPDALLLVGTMDFEGWDPTIFQSGKLIVQIGARPAIGSIVSCGMDEQEAAHQIIVHMRSLGHQTYGIVGDSSIPSQRRRERLVVELGNHRIGVPENWQMSSDAEFATAGRLSASHLLSIKNRAEWPTAVIATGDMIAIGFIRELQEAGVDVPGQLSVCSYNDIEFASFFSPSLTTIHQPVREMANAALRISLGNLPPETIRLKPDLVIRRSTSPPREPST